MPAIATDGLTKRYGDAVAVDHLDLTVERGEIFGLLGPNGAGKTTTVLMLLGLSEPTEGTVEVLGVDPRRHPLEVKRRVGYVPDAVGFYESLTARQNLRYTARLNRIPDEIAETRIAELLDEVGLGDRADDPVGAYSRGMRQRLGLADALVKDPDILILDEPTMAIDPEGVREILALIRSLPDRGVTVLVSSHLLDQVQSTCDRIGIFVSGRLVAHGTVEELATTHGAPHTIELRAEPAITEDTLRAIDGVVAVDSNVDEDGLVLVRATHDVTTDIARTLATRSVWPRHLARRHERLDDVYHRYFTEPDHDDRDAT